MYECGVVATLTVWSKKSVHERSDASVAHALPLTKIRSAITGGVDVNVIGCASSYLSLYQRSCIVNENSLQPNQPRKFSGIGFFAAVTTALRVHTMSPFSSGASVSSSTSIVFWSSFAP
jgi:hypothetical protein